MPANADWEKQILDTWNINNRINLYMLDAIPKDALDDVSASKGRNVAEQFAHIHNVRLMWLKVSGPELMEGLEKIEKEQASDRKLLERSLKASGAAMEQLLQKGIAEGKIKGFKPHLTAAMATGLPCITLSLPGIALDIDTPDDLRKLASSPGETRSQRLARQWDLAEFPLAANE